MRSLGSHEESTALPRQSEEAGPRLRNLHVMVTLLLMLAVLPEASFAKNNNPYFALKGQAMGPDTYEYKLEFTNTAGKTVTIELAVASAGPITDSLLATVIKDRLNSLDNVKDEYRFSAFQSDNTGWWYVYGVPQDGKKPKPLQGGVKISPGDKTLLTSAGVDPINGTASFDLSGSPSGGEVYLGVNGFFVSTTTSYDDETPKSLSQIKSELLVAFRDLAFPYVGINSTGQIYVSGISSGDPNTDDYGAVSMSTDPALEVVGNMALQAAAAPRPPRGAVRVSPLSGPVGTTVTVSISNFPANSTINIDFNGQRVTTVTTGANGAGTAMFVVPEGTAKGEREVRASGGSPLTFGYAWFTVR